MQFATGTFQIALPPALSRAADRAKAVTGVLGKADGTRSNRDRNAGAVATELESVSAQLAADAKAASGREAMRLNALSENLKERASKLK